LHLEVEVGADASAWLGTQASTKVYRSPVQSRQTLGATVADLALFACVPDPVVCFAGSDFLQRQHIALSTTANLVLVDGLSAGRSAYGERWVFSRYESRIDVDRAGRSLLRDALLLDPAHGALPVRLGEHDLLLTVIVTGPKLAAAAAALVTEVAAMPLSRTEALRVACSPLGEDGAILRIASRSIEQGQAALRRHLRFLPTLLGDDPWARRW
jgi:urease accessory protein